MSIDTRWYSSLDAQEKRKFEELLKNSTILLKRLDGVLDGFEESLDRIDYSHSAYDNPNWAYKQAHINGQRHAYKTVKQLLNFTRITK